MARTFGGVSTDKIIMADAAMPSNGAKTTHFWIYQTGDGGGSAGRIFERYPGGTEGLFHSSAGGSRYRYFRDFTVGGGEWAWLSPSLNAWHSILLTYDDSDVANVPELYYDGVSQSRILVGSPTSGVGIIVANEDYVIGNNTVDIRNFAGRICEVAEWSRTLTDNEIVALARGVLPWRIQDSLRVYVPILGLLSPEPDYSVNRFVGTVTGTVLANHAPITVSTPKAFSFPAPGIAPGILMPQMAM